MAGASPSAARRGCASAATPAPRTRRPRSTASDDLGKAKILVGVDGRLAGALVMGDSLREDAHEMVERLRSVGVRHIAS